MQVVPCAWNILFCLYKDAFPPKTFGTCLKPCQPQANLFSCNLCNAYKCLFQFADLILKKNMSPNFFKLFIVAKLASLLTVSGFAVF